MDIMHLVRAAAATAWIFGAVWIIVTLGSAFVAAWRDTHRPAAEPAGVADSVPARSGPERDAA